MRLRDRLFRFSNAAEVRSPQLPYQTSPDTGRYVGPE